MKYLWAQAINHVIGGFPMRAAASPNEVGGRTGGLNRAFKYLYLIRLAGKRRKAWNRIVYYIVKWFLFGGIAAAIFLHYSAQHFSERAQSLCRAFRFDGRRTMPAAELLLAEQVRKLAYKCGQSISVAPCLSGSGRALSSKISMISVAQSDRATPICGIRRRPLRRLVSLKVEAPLMAVMAGKAAQTSRRGPGDFPSA